MHVNKRILTIGREFGSEGHEIARLLAERLGIDIFDKDLLYKIAEQNALEASELAAVDEQKKSRWLLHPALLFGYSRSNSYSYIYGDLNDQLFKLQTTMIRQLAEKGPCIIVGRLGDYLLRDDPQCIKAFIYAPFEKRVEIIQDKHGLKTKDARRWVKEMDASRARYYRYYTDGKWNAKEGKDILLNRATLGIEGCVAILETMMTQ